ncbi:LCP family protein [Streptomyces sp. NPDC058045]|uniref:LCP family protein n=1 Tax=Streptomyces sp. NPDC058045 TaxID=3346311 RepID=UPI0036ED5B12
MTPSEVQGAQRPRARQAARPRGGAPDGPAEGGRRGGGHRRARPPRRRKHRILRWTALVLAVLVLGAAGAGYLYLRHLNGNLHKGERSSSKSGAKKPAPNAAGQTPLNILMLGSDSRNSAANVALGGSRSSIGAKPLADVQMLIHISADRKNASVVSIPRDTRVDIPACEDAKTHEKFPETNAIINESLGRGGPGCTLATWEKLTGVYINHWMMVDFAGVVRMADAVGGVEVCVKDNVWDRPLPGVPGGSGLKLKAGKSKVKGKQALQWLRTRHAFMSDLGRAKAQHMYMNSMVRTLKGQSVFSDSGRLTDLAEAATKSLTVSQEIGTVRKLYDLAMQLKSVPMNRMTTVTMPSVEDPQDRNHLLPAPIKADKVWSMLRSDVPLDKNGKKDQNGQKDGFGKDKASPKPSPSAGSASAAPAGTFPVQVRNGTGGDGEAPVPGRATQIVGLLQGQGFTQAMADRSVFPTKETVLAYPRAGGDQARANALSVAARIDLPEKSVRASDSVAAVTLTIGGDWREGDDYPKAEAPSAGDVPDGTDELNGSDSSACMDVYRPYRW